MTEEYLPTTLLVVYCWDCDGVSERNASGSLYAPCGNCGSKRLHVFPKPRLPKRKKRRVLRLTPMPQPK